MEYAIILTLLLLLLLWAALALMTLCKEMKKEKPQWGVVFFSIFFALISTYGVLAILIIR